MYDNDTCVFVRVLNTNKYLVFSQGRNPTKAIAIVKRHLL